MAASTVLETPIDKVGQVTAPIRAGNKGVGEVLLGSESFLARPQDPRDTFIVGEEVVVVDFQPPRTVYVERAARVSPIEDEFVEG